MHASGTLSLTPSIIKSLPKEHLEKTFSDAYADWLWLQQEGRHKNDPHYNRLAIQVMDIMEEIQRTIARKSGYRS
jgi:hypothetical protein